MEALVREHLERGGDAERSVAALGAFGTVCDDADPITEPDLPASLAHPATGQLPDPDGTVTVDEVPSTSGGSRSRAVRPPPARNGLGEALAFCDEELKRAVARFLFTEKRLDHGGLPAISGLAQFELLDELGRGGMGVVYKARHRLLNRIVALKMIGESEHASRETRERFLIEAEVVARLRHPNIVQIYDIGEANGRPFVTLELLEGGSLADRLRGMTQPARAAAALVATLATAVHAAHQAGIVHRDLKPPNVLFDREGTPKITDFGLAKRLEVDEGQTRTGQVMGTPSYMAPEQAQGEVHKVGPAADIYALGALLYEMLTGRRCSTRCSPAGRPSRGRARWRPCTRSSTTTRCRLRGSSRGSRATWRRFA
jgi:serine/threonine protein kinase